MPAAGSAAPISVLARIDEQYIAAQLAVRGLRLGALRSLFRDLPAVVLSRICRETNGVKAAPGRLPASFFAQIRSPADAAAGAVLLYEYLRLGGTKAHIDPVVLMAAWDRLQAMVGRNRSVTLDPTSLWLLLRDYRAGRVDLALCGRCGTRRLAFAGDPQYPCPNCSAS